MNSVQIEDCQNIGDLGFIDWNKLKNSTILVTGSTGLIGSNFVNAVAYNSQSKDLKINLILPVRNTDVAKKYFAWTDAEIFSYNLGEELKFGKKVDYIVHLASPTSSKYFTEKPVDTVISNIEGTRALLDWAKQNSVKKFVMLSTMEVYGLPEKGHKVQENELGAFETMKARNSYPIAKIACEALCNAYAAQYKVPAVILRATQTFGPGVKYNDGRIFAEFMRCVIENRNIVLKSTGLTERNYLYTADAVSAIVVALLRAKAGEAYTIANPETYCSIKDFALLVANKVANGKIKVLFDIEEDITKYGFAETLYMNLDISKMSNLGWEPTLGLEDMFKRMVKGVSIDV